MFLKLLFCLFAVSFSTVVNLHAISDRVYLISIKDSINNVTGDYIINTIKKANTDAVKLVIIELNTAGDGQIDVTRNIVQEILSSKVPVAVNVTPSGAQAGSAGIMITMAANIAAMAPSTTIGAAPQVINDLSSIVKGISKVRKRNVQWFAITSEEALKKKVIDYVVKDTRDLLSKLEGKFISKKEFIELRMIPMPSASNSIVKKDTTKKSSSSSLYIIMILVVFISIAARIFFVIRKKK